MLKMLKLWRFCFTFRRSATAGPKKLSSRRSTQRCPWERRTFRTLSRVRHIAFNALVPDRVLSFYTEVLGLRELGISFERRQQKLGNRFAGDGFTNLAIHPFYDTKEGHEAGFGVNHIGFLVQDLQHTIENLSDIASIKPRPTNRPYAEFRFRDPEGNRLDLSQTKGWEVDIDEWERAAVEVAAYS